MEKWVTFDLDGTLMKNPFSNWVFPEIESILQKYAKCEMDFQKILIDEHERRMSENKVLEAYDWDNIVANLLSDLKINKKISVEQLVKKHAISPKIYLLEQEVIENLKKIKSMGYNLAAVTNGYYKYQIPVMKSLGLKGIFDEIITPDTCGYAKPNVDILNVLDGKIVAHVGDRIDHDIIMANQLGITSVFISNELPQHVLDIPVNERKNDKGFLKICQEKWNKENSGYPVFFHNKCIPDMVISSIVELSRSLKSVGI